LTTIISLKRSSNQNIRDLSSRVLEKLSPEKLVSCYTTLIEMLRSPYAFVRSESETLLNKINPELIFDQFDYLRDLENDRDYGIKRFATATVLKIAAAWSLKEKKLHYPLILEWQKSKDEKTVSIANLIALQVMESWEIKSLEPFMPFLVSCADFNKNDLETVELAVSLTFKFLSEADLSLRLEYLDYMTEFSDYGIKEIRRGFRHLALTTIKVINPSNYSKYSVFFLRCLEAKNKDDRTIAWKSLLLIDPSDLPVCQLVYCQVCGLYRVRRAGKKLAKRVGDDVLLENLEELLRLQDSDCFEVRSFSRYLITKIPFVRFKEKKEVLAKAANSRTHSQLVETLLGFC
jgi:hypothetical protein